MQSPPLLGRDPTTSFAWSVSWLGAIVCGGGAPMPGGGSWRTLFSDKAGNNERLAYIFDASKITLCERVADGVATPP